MVEDFRVSQFVAWKGPKRMDTCKGDSEKDPESQEKGYNSGTGHFLQDIFIGDFFTGCIV